MLTAGRSVLRVLAPLIIVGLLAAGGCFALNYQWAPHAEAVKERALELIVRGKKAGKVQPIEAHVFVDRVNNRVWYVREMVPGQPKLSHVQVVQKDEAGNIIKKWYARAANYDARTGAWTLVGGMAVEFNTDGDITQRDVFPNKSRVVRTWTETPWRISSSRMEAQNLSVPELQEYLKYNADFPAAQLAPYRTNLADRWAFPWSCLVVVFIAAPLGIVFSRRGVLAGVASSIFIFFGMILLRYLFLALGKGGHLDPIVAAWLPNAFFMAVGLLLLYFRSTNRDLPTLLPRRR